jgi:hypothetical protein
MGGFSRLRGMRRQEWRKLHELNKLYCSPNIVRVIKLRRLRWVVHVAHMGDRISIYRVLVQITERKSNLEVPGVDGRKILRWILRMWMWGHGLDRASSA